MNLFYQTLGEFGPNRFSWIAWFGTEYILQKIVIPVEKISLI